MQFDIFSRQQPSIYNLLLGIPDSPRARARNGIWNQRDSTDGILEFFEHDLEQVDFFIIKSGRVHFLLVLFIKKFCRIKICNISRLSCCGFYSAYR